MLSLDLEGLSYLGAASRQIAGEAAAPYVDLVLSGYGSAIAEGWLALWRGATGRDVGVSRLDGAARGTWDVKKENNNMVAEAKHILSRYWKI